MPGDFAQRDSSLVSTSVGRHQVFMLAVYAHVSRVLCVHFTVQLWVGPIRQTHNMSIDMENGSITPYRSVLKFKKGVGPVLRVITTDSVEFPMEAAISVPSKERSELIGKTVDRLFDASEKLLIQGGDITSAKGGGFGKTGGTGGAVRTYPIPTDVNAVQVICWSRDTGTKSLKCRIELLQGPNNVKQNYDLQVSGSHQPFTCVFRTPGPGYQIRIQNKKFVEDGLFQVAMIPIDE